MILSPDPSCSSVRCFKSFKKEFCTSDPFRADRNRSPNIVIFASTMFRGKEDMLMLDSGHCYEKLAAREYGKGKLQSLEEAGKTCMSVQTHTPKRKRNLPGNPDPDAEVVALSPKSLMATNRFVCEICSKGFQRDQNLQLHRRGHNLPWKLKQKSSTEMKKRVYICPEPSCVHHDSSRALGDLTGIKKHYSRKHGEKKWKCDKCSKQYAVHSDWKAHSKACGSREYRCNCGTLFSRRDSFVTHRAFCDALAQETARISANLHGVVNDILGNEQGIIISASNGNPSSSSPTRAGHHHHHLGSWSHPHTNDNNNLPFSVSSFISQQQVEGGIRMGFQENDLIPAWDSQTRPGSGVFSWPPPPPMEESTDDISPFHFVSPNVFFDSHFYEGDKTVVGGGKHSASRLASEFGVNSAGLSLSFNDYAMNGPKDHHIRNNINNNNTNSIDSAYYDVPLSLRRYGMAADLESSHLHPPLSKPGGILSPPFNAGPSSSSSSTLTDFIPCSSFESSQQPMTAAATAVQQFMNSFSSSSADMNIPQSKLLLNPTQKKQGLLDHPSISPTSLQNATTLKPPSNLGWELEVPHHSRLTRDFLGVGARTLSQSQLQKLRSRMEM